MQIDERFKNDPLYASLFKSICFLENKFKSFYAEVTLATYQDLLNYKFTEQKVFFTIINDQGTPYTSYRWNGAKLEGSKLFYNVETESDFQPTINQ